MSFLDALVRSEVLRLSAYRPHPHPQGAIRLDANESPHGLLPEERELLARALASVETHRYPDVRAGALRARLAGRLEVSPEALVLGCGSDEVIAMLLTALCRPRLGL